MTTDTDFDRKLVETLEAQLEVNRTVSDALNTLAVRLTTLEARIGRIARNLPKS